MRIAFDERIAPVGELKEIQEILTAGTRRTLFQTVQVGNEAEEFTATELLIKKRTIRDEADLPLGLLGRTLDVILGDRGSTSTRLEQADEDFDGGGFASTVWSQETKKLALRDLQIEIFHRDKVAIALLEIDYADHAPPPLSSCRLPGFTGWLPCWQSGQVSG